MFHQESFILEGHETDLLAGGGHEAPYFLGDAFRLGLLETNWECAPFVSVWNTKKGQMVYRKDSTSTSYSCTSII